MANSNERALVRVIQIASGLGLGVMAALLASLDRVTPDLALRFSIRTVLAFIGALAFSWLFWKVVFQQPVGTGRAGPSRRRAFFFAALSGVLCLATLTSFGISLKGLGNERIREVIQGVSHAILFLSFVGFVLWRIGLFLEADSRKVRDPNDPDDPESPDRP